MPTPDDNRFKTLMVARLAKAVERADKYSATKYELDTILIDLVATLIKEPYTTELLNHLDRLGI